MNRSLWAWPLFVAKVIPRKGVCFFWPSPGTGMTLTVGWLVAMVGCLLAWLVGASVGRRFGMGSGLV